MLVKSLVWCLVVAMSILSAVPQAEGSFVPSEAINIGDSQRAADIEKIQNVLEEKLVSQKLEDLGFSTQEVRERLSRLSNEQIHNYAQKLDELRAGGFHSAMGEYHYELNLVIVILLIVLLILLIVSVQDYGQEAKG